jgi:hypothetical protein
LAMAHGHGAAQTRQSHVGRSPTCSLVIAVVFMNCPPFVR